MICDEIMFHFRALYQTEFVTIFLQRHRNKYTNEMSFVCHPVRLHISLPKLANRFHSTLDDFNFCFIISSFSPTSKNLSLMTVSIQKHDSDY
jgi:hypothetical protein